MVADTKLISAMHRSASKIYASDETVEIFVEADFETHAEERRRFAILNIPRNLFSEASGAAARRSSTRSLKTAWIGDGRLGSSTQHVSDGASRDASTALPPRSRETALIKSTRPEASWGRSRHT
jgi:hypothetical protein